jgi:Putative ATPase subunit of terminase (gpP-like)
MASPVSAITASATTASAAYVPAAQISQIQLLYQQGVSPAEIAAMLGLSAAAVDGYLGIGTPGVVLLPTLAETPASTGPGVPTISTFG